MDHRDFLGYISLSRRIFELAANDWRLSAIIDVFVSCSVSDNLGSAVGGNGRAQGRGSCNGICRARIRMQNPATLGELTWTTALA